MRAFITVGTLSFLKKYITKHPQITFYFMSNMYGSGTLVYYEHQRKKIFAAGKVFNILFAQGELQEKGYVSMETIPVSVDAQPLFEEQIRQQQQQIKQMTGFHAFRLLKPRRGHNYVIISQWKSPTYFEQWEKNKDEIIIKQSAYFVDRPFSASYMMVDFEEEIPNN